MNAEKRTYKTELRADDKDGNVTVTGHAALYNEETRIGWFYEVIEPGAFDDAIRKSDIRALKNHDPNLILGRTKSNTLSVEVDGKGLFYRYVSPDTSYAKDLLVSLRRGDIDESSFAFTLKRKDEDGVNGDEWHEDENGKITRTIKKNGVKMLYDVTVATYGAYPQTNSQVEHNTAVAKRSFDRFKNKDEDDKNQRAKEELEQKAKENEQTSYLQLAIIAQHQ